jgi:hypothetical protein
MQGLARSGQNDRNVLSNIYLFQTMKSQLKGRRFHDIVEIPAELQVVLDSIMK